MVEQGLSFTVIEGPHPIGQDSSFNPRRDFEVAYRVWLGSVPGTDWLHEEIESELGEDSVQYLVETRRDSVHVGAAGETATVILIFLGVVGWSYIKAFGGKLGEAHAEALLSWARERARKRREKRLLEQGDGPPDFRLGELEHLVSGMLRELADLTEIPAERLELLSSVRSEVVVLRARYRDKATGREYEVTATRDSATFRPVRDPD